MLERLGERRRGGGVGPPEGGGPSPGEELLLLLPGIKAVGKARVVVMVGEDSAAFVKTASSCWASIVSGDTGVAGFDAAAKVVQFEGVGEDARTAASD